VVGPGRSGTTLVAKILHERLNVYMGQRFRNDPEGKCYFEDLDFRDLNRHFMDGRVVFNDWLINTEKLIYNRNNMGRLWGFKDPRASYIMGMYLSFFDIPPKFLRCKRDQHAVAQSMTKNYGWPPERALQVAMERDRALDRVLVNQIKVEMDFSEWRTDDWVVERIPKEWLHVDNDRRFVPGKLKTF